MVRNFLPCVFSALFAFLMVQSTNAAVKTIDWDDDNTYAPMTASVGDTLTFSIAGKDDWVQLLPDMKAFQACDFKNATALYTKPLPQKPATPVLITFMLSKAGDYFFSSGSMSGVDDKDDDPQAANMTQCKAKNFKLQVTATSGGGAKNDSTSTKSSASSVQTLSFVNNYVYVLLSLPVLAASTSMLF